MRPIYTTKYCQHDICVKWIYREITEVLTSDYLHKHPQASQVIAACGHVELTRHRQAVYGTAEESGYDKLLRLLQPRCNRLRHCLV